MLKKTCKQSVGEFSWWYLLVSPCPPVFATVMSALRKAAWKWRKISQWWDKKNITSPAVQHIPDTRTWSIALWLWSPWHRLSVAHSHCGKDQTNNFWAYSDKVYTCRVWCSSITSMTCREQTRTYSEDFPVRGSM